MRLTGHGCGGVLVAFKLHYSEVNIDFNSELVALQIKGVDKSPIAVASVCRQPSTDLFIIK